VIEYTVYDSVTLTKDNSI